MKHLPALGLILIVLLSCGLGEKAEQFKDIAKNLEEAGKNLESGDTTAAEEAFGRILGGGDKVDPVDFRKLKALLPERLAGLPRTNSSGEKSGVLGISTSKTEGEYRSDDGQQRLTVTITDLGSVRGLGMLGFDWMMVDIDRESDTGYERTTTYKSYPAYEKFQQSGSHISGEMSAFVGKRFMVNIAGQGLDMDDIKDAMDDISVRRLEAMKDEGVGEAAERVAE